MKVKLVVLLAMLMLMLAVAAPPAFAVPQKAILNACQATDGLPHAPHICP